MTPPTGLEINVDVTEALRTVEGVRKRFAPTTFLKVIGQRHLAWVNQNVRDEGTETAWHPMAANTRAKRGAAARLLRDRGRLAQSFTVSVTGETVRVGTSDRRARWHHEGTRPYTIQPRAKRALRFVTVNGVTIRTVVHHPGLPARPLLPSQRLAEALAQETMDAAVAKLVADAERGA